MAAHSTIRGRRGPFTIAVYCSEFVALSGQLATTGDEGAAFFIEFDGKHMPSKDLRSWVPRRSVAGGTCQVPGDLMY